MPDGFRITARVGETIADLIAVAGQVDDATAAATRDATLYMAGRVKAHASGRPGPRVQTGAYRRSIRSSLGFARGRLGARILTGEVFTNAEQGRRLEYGFIGADVLGRVYNQPAYPHWEPAARETERFLAGRVERGVAGVVDGFRP